MTATIPSTKLSLIRKLYCDQSLSAKEVAESLGETTDAVYYFLRRNLIPRRSAREQNALRFARKPLSFKIKSNLSNFDTKLFVAGVALYWAEGSKWKGEKSVDFANSDSQMVVVFVRFLRQICGVNEARLRCYIYCYQNQNIEEIVRYWSELTNIPDKQFTKPYVRKDFKLSKSGKMPYGLIHIRYSDKRLLDKMRGWMAEIAMLFAK